MKMSKSKSESSNLKFRRRSVCDENWCWELNDKISNEPDELRDGDGQEKDGKAKDMGSILN
jgi:hypothetical protein